MESNKAYKVFRLIDENESIRRELLSCITSSELKEYLYNREMIFSFDELDELVLQLKSKDAPLLGKDALKARIEWFSLLLFSLS